jgi:hypothetical protein
MIKTVYLTSKHNTYYNELHHGYNRHCHGPLKYFFALFFQILVVKVLKISVACVHYKCFNIFYLNSKLSLNYFRSQGGTCSNIVKVYLCGEKLSFSFSDHLCKFFGIIITIVAYHNCIAKKWALYFSKKFFFHDI